MPNSNQSGFSLAEVMFVLVIAAILFGIVIVAFQTLSRNGRNEARASDRYLIAGTLLEFYAKNRSLPSKDQLQNLLEGSESELNLIGLAPDGTLNAIQGGTSPIVISSSTPDRQIYIVPGQLVTARQLVSVQTFPPPLDHNSLVIITGILCAEIGDLLSSGPPYPFKSGRRGEEDRSNFAMYFIEEGTELLQCVDY